jgi:predicted unusual protein kinase regulating ubiquinone biosynthesis (AarF/ABC1/UbiB family)
MVESFAELNARFDAELARLLDLFFEALLRKDNGAALDLLHEMDRLCDADMARIAADIELLLRPAVGSA